MIIIPLYKSPLKVDDIQEARDYLQYMIDENIKICHLYNDLERKKDEQEVRIKHVYRIADKMKEIIKEGYKDD